MKKRILVITALICGMICTALLSGCSLSGGSNAEVQELLVKCASAGNALESYDAEITFDTNVQVITTAGGQSNQFVWEENSTVIEYCFLNPYKIKLMKLDNTEGANLNAVQQQAYLKVEDNQMQINLDDGAGWSKFNEGASPVGVASVKQLNQVDFFTKITLDARITGMETINGYDAYKIEGIIDGSFIGSLVKDFQVQFGREGNRSIQGFLDENATGDISDIHVSYWIDKEDGHCVRIRMNMTDAYRSILEQKGVEPRTEEKMTIDIEMYHFNNATEFELPQ